MTTHPIGVTAIRRYCILTLLVFSALFATAQNTATTCSGVTLKYSNEPGYQAGETYSWTVLSSSPDISGSSPGLGGASVIAQTLLNSSNIPETITYNVVTNKATSFTLTVTVNPTDNITNQSSFISPICSGDVQNFAALSDISGTSINWTRAPKPGISNLGGAGTTNVTETLINTTTSPITVPYLFTLVTGAGCVSNFTINAVVNPTPLLTSVINPAAICSGTNFSYTPTANTGLTTSFSWSRAALASISNPALSGNGNPSELLISTSASVVVVPYVYTITSNGCSNTATVNATVNPTPVVSTTQTATVCNNGAFTISPAGVTANTLYTWNSPTINPAGAITGASSQPVPQININQTLSNSTSNSATASYTITPTAGGCVGPSFTGLVTVLPSLSPVNNLVNQTITACSNAPFSLTPAGVPSGTQYKWTAPAYSPVGSLTGGVAQGTASNSIFGTLVNSTTSPGTAVYTVTPILGACTGTNFTVSVTINNPALLSSSLTPPAICNNALFSYTPTSNTANTSFTWTRTTIAGISNTAATGSANPNEPLNNISTVPVTVNYQYLLTTGSCVNAQVVSVTVNPSAKLSSATPNAICSGAKFNYNPLSATTGTIFTWSRPVVPSISNAAATGSGNPNEFLINTGINPILVPYTFTLSANGCTSSEIVDVLVNPIPVVSNQIATVCNNSAFSIIPSNVPVGTMYTWATPTYSPVLSVTGGSAQANPQTSISQILTNLTLNPATANYTVTPSANGCAGSTFNIAVSVSAATQFTSSITPPAICSNTAFNYTPSSNTFGTAFGWTRASIPGISNAVASGSGNPNETLINTSANVVAVPYLFTLTTPAGCVSTQTVTINVNPAPVLSSTLTPPAICTGTSFNYSPSSASAGAAFSWSRPIVPTISNAAGSGSGLLNPNEMLVNTSNVPVSVPYNYSIVANGCSNNQTVTVVVNPLPRVNNQSTTICANNRFTVIPTGVLAGTQYSWGIPSASPLASISGGSASVPLQDSISQMLGNLTTNQAKASYSVTPVANGCIGPNFTVDVFVNPAPVIPNQTIAAVCSGSAFNFTANPVPAGTVYTWSNPVISPSGSLNGGAAQSVSQVSISQMLSSTNNLMDTASYTVSPVSAGCNGADFVLTVPVKPVPVVNNLFDTVCSGSGFSVIPAPVPANTTYTWSLPNSIPFGAVIGGSKQTIPQPLIAQVLTNTSNNTAQVLYTVTPSAAGCSGAAFTLLETVGLPLKPIPNAAVTICSGTAFDVTPVTAPANTTYTWNIASVTPTGTITGLSAQSSPVTKVNGKLTNLSAADAIAVYNVVPFNTGCTGSAFKATITVNAVPKATIIGSPVICAYAYDTLTVNFAGNAPWSFNYLDNGVPKTQSGITASPYTWIVPTPLLSTSKSLAITYVKDLACVDSVDTSFVVQKVNPLPIATIQSLHGQYICNNIFDTLLVKYSAMDTLLYQWTLNGVQVPGITADSVATLVPGRYNAYFTNKYGCTDTAASPITLTYIAQPVIKFNYDNYCINNNIIFRNLTDTSFTGPTSWQWDMGDSTTRNSFDANVVYPTAGNRHIKLTAFQFYCPAYTTSFDSTVNIEFPIAGVRMPSVSAYLGQFTPLQARTFPNYKYLWTPTRGIDHKDSASVLFNYQQTQDYLINLIAPSGCVTKDSMLVRVFDDKLVDIFVPKSFTPNNDGVNDILYPYLSGIKTFQYFKVYNRFGKLMYESKDPDAGWNGMVNGTPQPMAIYIWVSAGTDLNGNLVEKRGETLLLR